jgi:hypothetical protein
MMMQAYNELYKTLSEGMTPAKAYFIKSLRIECGYSWGAIAREYALKYPKEEIKVTSPYGKEICNAAMNYLDETVDDGWN